MVKSTPSHKSVHPKPKGKKPKLKPKAKPKAKKPINAGKPWRDQDLKLIIETQGTPANVAKWAAHFDRSEKAIVCIYRWALSSRAHIEHSKKKGVTGLPLRVWSIANDLGIVCQGCP